MHEIIYPKVSSKEPSYSILQEKNGCSRRSKSLTSGPSVRVQGNASFLSPPHVTINSSHVPTAFFLMGFLLHPGEASFKVIFLLPSTSFTPFCLGSKQQSLAVFLTQRESNRLCSCSRPLTNPCIIGRITPFSRAFLTREKKGLGHFSSHLRQSPKFTSQTVTNVSSVWPL